MERLSKPIKFLGIPILFTAFVFASGTVTLAAPLMVQRTAAAVLSAHQVEPDAAFRTEKHISSSITYSKTTRQQQGDDILQQIDAIMPTAEELELPQPPFVLKESVSGILTLQQYIDVFQNQGEAEVAAAIRRAGTDYHFAGQVYREWNTWGETWEVDTSCPDTVYMTVGTDVLVFGSEDLAVAFVADKDLHQAWMSAVNTQSVDILEASPAVFTMRNTFDSACGALTLYLKMGHVGPFVVESTVTAYAGVREDDMWNMVDRINGIVMQRLAQPLPSSEQPAINHCLQTPGVLNSFNVFAQSFAGSPTIVDSGGSYWIQMSTGYEEGGEAEEARADQPNISFSVTMNGVELPMTGPTRVEYIDRSGFWAVNSYHCTGPLEPGSYNIVGTSYRSGEVIDSVSFVLLAKAVEPSSEQPAINHCLQTPGVPDTFNVFAQSFAGSPTIVDSGGSYWIRMSTGYEEGGEAEEARADQPNISLSVTMNGVELPMTGPTRVEYNDRAGFWEVNSYHCTGPLEPGSYNIVGTSYRSGEVIDSVSFVLLAKAVEPSSSDDILQQVNAIMPTVAELGLSELPSAPDIDWHGTMEEIRDGLINSPGNEKAGDARQQAGTNYHFQGAVYRMWRISWEPGEECLDEPFTNFGIFVHAFGSQDEARAFLADEDVLLAWERADMVPTELDTSAPGVLTERQSFGDTECGIYRGYGRWIVVGRFAIETYVMTYSDTNEAEMWGIIDHTNQIVAQKLTGAGIE